MKVLSFYKKKKQIGKLYPELSIKMIADRLDLHPKTVHDYILDNGLQIDGENRLYYLKLEFSKSRGYKNLAEAIGDMGFYQFQREFKKTYPNYKPSR